MCAFSKRYKASPYWAFLAGLVALGFGANVMAQPASDTPSGGVTSLTNKRVTYEVSSTHYHKMQRNGVVAIVVDNAANAIVTSSVAADELKTHRAGYSGLGYLGRVDEGRNLFVPTYAGLNYEHIHDGDTRNLIEKFEPRRFPLELRVVDQYTVELYQAPTGNFHLESCGRYAMLADGTIEYTFECIPRKKTFTRDFIGLFWASYIHQPGDKAIHIRGRNADDSDGPTRWIKAITPKHGELAGHAPAGRPELPEIDAEFPLTLVNHPSRYVATEPWYFGVSGDHAYVQMFRERDNIWIVQSPSGGGDGNPAWDFQWFSSQARVDHVYGFKMRAAYLPYIDKLRLAEFAKAQLAALNQ
jgi:hypothetical protein